MADMSSLFQKGLSQIAQGQKLDSDTISGESSSPSGGKYVGMDDDLVYRGEEDRSDSPVVSEPEENSADGTPSDSEESSEAAPAKGDEKAATPETSTKETITVSDDKGRRKIAIDYSDRVAIKKAFLEAAGFRKFQHERDNALKRLGDVEKKLGDSESTWNILNETYSREGIEGLVNLIEGPGKFQEWEEKRATRRDFLRSASPEERESFEMKERLSRLEQDKARQKKEYDDQLRKVEAEREAADMAQAASKVNPVFSKYRFEGKLGDPDTEQMFDEMLWSTALKRLEPYEEKYGSAQAIPQEVINSTFKDVASKVNARIKQHADKKAKQVVEQKKQEATENVQAKVKSGYQTGSLAKEAGDLVSRGDARGLLRNFGKYQSVFARK